MRPAHYLRGNANSETPSAAIWFDTETKPETIGKNEVSHRLWFGWACYRRLTRHKRWTKGDWLRFTDAVEFWAWVSDRARDKTKLYLFCHNTSFDLPVLDIFGNLPAFDWKLKQAVIDAPPTILKFTRPRQSLMVLDTLNIWRMPLKKLGAMISRPKLNMPLNEDPKEAWDEYARQDVTVIMEACLQWWAFLKQEDLGGFATTLAGQALRTYRHRYMPAKILIDDHPGALDLARRAYVGGRCECFRLGHVKSRLRVMDVNSMYPAMMAKHVFPARLVGYDDRYPERSFAHYFADYCVVADAVIQTDLPAYPVVIDKKLCFPVGRFRVPLCGPELGLALQHGHLQGIERVAIYEPAPIFQDFALDMWERRRRAEEAGNTTRSWLFKILASSLYGKFGQRGIVWQEEDWIDDLTAKVWLEIDYTTREVRKVRQLCGLVQTQATESEGRDSSPAIAAYVTAYARVHLWRLILQAGRANVVYCDTDSVTVTPAGYRRIKCLTDPTKLGALKCEHVSDGGDFWGPKDYRLGEREKHKGIKKSAVWIDHNRVLQEKWVSLKGALRAGMLDQARTLTIEKTLTRAYTKGHVQPSGLVTPIVLDGL